MKKFFGYFKLSNLKKQISELGGEVTTKNFAMILLIVILGAFTAGILLKLEWLYVAIVAVFFLMFTPIIIVLQFRATYERTRFSDIIEYMEQMIYSFHKSNKLRDALVDTYTVSSPAIQRIINKMVDVIDYDMSMQHIYEKACKVMEDNYNNTRLHVLHNFLIECEYAGGVSGSALNLMLEDIRSWGDRTLEYQNERQKNKRNVIISIFLAMISCGMMLTLIPSEYNSQIVASSMYQIGTTIVLCLCVIVYVVVASKVSISYFDLEIDGDTDARTKRKVEYINRYNRRNHLLETGIMFGIFAIAIGVEVFIKAPFYVYAFTGVSFLVLILTAPIKKNNAIQYCTKEVTKTFPVWMRNLILYLQTDNVHVAIKKSLAVCPPLLKTEVQAFLKDIGHDPVSMKPFNKFLSAYNVPTLRLSISYLYSLSQFGAEDGMTQLNYLVAQNLKLTVQEENIRNEAALAGIGAWVFAPMVIAIFKLMLDMILMLNVFMGQVGGYI